MVSVVIAGGGTGGHIEPALALADALRRADPDIAITCLGTERGLETRLVPLRGYDLALIPPVPLPRKLTPALLSVPGRMLGAVGATAGDPGAGPGRRAGRLRRLRGDPRLPGRPPPQGADRGARGQRQARPGQPDRRAADHARVHRPAGHEAAARALHRHPDPARDLRAGPAGAGRQGARALRPAARPAGAARHRRLAGCRVAQPGGPRRRPTSCARPGSRCCTWSARRPATSRCRQARCRTSCCPTWTGWTWATRPPTSRCAGPAR